MANSRALTPRFICLRQPLQAISPRARPRNHTHNSQGRTYYSYEHDPTPPFTPAESSILSAALIHVPHHGFTASALTLGARDAGYPDVSTNLFPRGPFDLIHYHLVTQRLALGTQIQFPDAKMGVGARVRALALQRLRANKAVIHRWQEVRYNVHDSLSWPLSLLCPRAPIRIGIQERSAGGRPRADRVLWFSSVIKVWSHNRAAGDYTATRVLVSCLMIELHD